MIDSTTPYWQHLFTLCEPPSGDDVITFSATGSVNYYPERFADPDGAPENRPAEVGFAAYGPTGMQAYSFCILLSSEADGDPPPALAYQDDDPPEGGVSQNENVAMPGSGATYTAGEWAALAAGVSYPLKAYGIFNDIRFQDNTGGFSWSADLPDHALCTCTPPEIPALGAIGLTINNVPAVRLTGN